MVHQFSYSTGIERSFPGIKRLGRQATTHFLMKKEWSCTCIPVLYLNPTRSTYRLMRRSFPRLIDVALTTDKYCA
jgi:hypothetical protein